MILTITAAPGNVLRFGITAAGTDGRYLLPVFETSDVHGYIAEKDGDNYQYRLAYISDKVKDARGYASAYDKNAALLLDAGDIYQGSTMSNLLNGDPLAGAYALMDYDAVTVGNHEFDWGIETVIDGDGTMRDCSMEGFAAENKVPVVISNLCLNSGKADWMQDCAIVTKTARNADGEAITVKIGVIGFAEDSHLPHVRLHDLRHSTASNLLQNGASLPAVSSWVGHSSPETTLRFYAHANMDDKKAISGLVEKMINIV